MHLNGGRRIRDASRSLTWIRRFDEFQVLNLVLADRHLRRELLQLHAVVKSVCDGDVLMFRSQDFA